MGGKRTAGIALLIVGIIILILALAADVFGLGDVIGLGVSPGFGSYQIIGAVVGVIVAAIGAFLMR